MSEFLQFLQYEWFQINKKAKWFIYTGIVLLIFIWSTLLTAELSWLDRKMIYELSFKQLTFLIAWALIISAIIYELWDNIFRSAFRVYGYKMRYPLRDLGKKYELFDVYMSKPFEVGSGRLFLLDHEKLHWVANTRTYEDLNFTNCWKKITWDDLTRKCKFVAEPIITRGECR